MTAFRWSRAWRIAPLVGGIACHDAPVEPEPDPVRTVVVHREDTGANLLLNSDGTDAGAYTPGTAPVPLAASPLSGKIVLLNGGMLTIGTVGQPGLDTILNPAPTSMSLAAISDDELVVAIVSYEPTKGLIVYDRANRAADTLDYGPVDPVLPPVIAPDNDRIVLIGLTPLSLTTTSVYRSDRSRRDVDALQVSRFLNRPIFGWPRWVEDGIAMAFVRVADDGPDTLLVGRVRPDDPTAPLEELYRAVMAPVSDNRPELGINASSTYALTRDGMALALGAQPVQDAGRHAIYVVTPRVPRVQLVRDDPAQYLAFPLFVRD